MTTSYAVVIRASLHNDLYTLSADGYKLAKVSVTWAELDTGKEQLKNLVALISGMDVGVIDLQLYNSDDHLVPWPGSATDPETGNHHHVDMATDQTATIEEF
jgi:hypothetical protein